MKLHIFQSDHGDCLLLEGRDGGRVLCDGGMSSSMREHVRAKLSKLRRDGKVVDYAYVSHIDQDHISGVLQLLEDELEWRIYEHHEDNGTPVAPPEFPRPPEIKGIWHNAFREQIKDNKGEIEELLAAAAPALLASSVQELVSLGEQMQEIALSIPEAVAVSRYASPEVLDIPINQLPGVSGKPKLLMFREDQAAFDVGSMQFTIVGPTAAELRLLRAGWNNFLRDLDNRRKLRNLRDEIRRKVDSFGQENFDLRDWNGIEDFKGVTTPNIASLMFMVEEDGKRLLLTGDSQQDIILNGLELAGYLDEGYIHLDVLKVQHHGSENNLDENFCRRVSADHYVFCGNGSNGNPEQSVIEMVFESREGAKAKRALAPEAEGRKYRFWFSTTSEEQVPESKQAETFAEIEALVADLIARSNGKLSAKFNTGASITLRV